MPPAAPEPDTWAPAAKPALSERLARLQELHGVAGDPPSELCPNGCGAPATRCLCPPPTDAEAEATLLDHFPDATVTVTSAQPNR